MCADSRFAKPHKFPKGNGFILFASTKRTGSSRRAAALSTPGDGSKLYRLYFFVTFPAFVFKPAYGATHFFGCFEPVRKGYCTSDARPIFFENGLLYCKLTGANVFKKGSCSLSWLRWEFEILVCWLKVLRNAKVFEFVQNCGMLIENFDLNQSFVFPEKFRSI